MFGVVPSALLVVPSFRNEGANVAANRLHAAAVFDVKCLLVFYFRHESKKQEILINCHLITPVVGSQVGLLQ